MLPQNLKSWLPLGLLAVPLALTASSHREAPLIAQDPLADNTDVYAFRSPDDSSSVTLIANYIPMQLPQGGPNYYHFSEDVRYEIHVDNDASTPGDDVIYRFTFDRVNEDPTTFFNIRLGAENLNTSYTLERSTDGGMSYETIISDGMTPAYNIGPRSIESAAGLGADYASLMEMSIEEASTGERVFAGPVDDPFYVDFSVFDLGDAPRQNGEPRDGLECFNVHTLAIQVPIANLLKEGAPAEPTSILDPDYVIGVWASASRKAVRTLSDGLETQNDSYDGDGGEGEGESNPFIDFEGDYVQVSRLGMPLTNEVVIPIGLKDYWNAITPYDELADTRLDESFYNPELGLYMDTAFFAAAVPAFEPLRIQENSLGMFDFTNTADGLFPLKGSEALDGTALSEDAFGALLLPAAGKPRSVDLWPIFHTGVPNLPPYQLATGKAGNPLAAGKPFVNNFLPNGGDMLRLNMAVPATPRDSDDFSSLGLVQAAVLGLTDPRFAANSDVQFIPNMDGFPNGRRLEDDVTRIELQAVSGVVLAAIGLFYDDYDPASGESPVTQDLLDVLTYTTGVEANDIPFMDAFPYEAAPRRGTGPCSGEKKDFTSPFTDLELEIDLVNRNFVKFQEVPYQITVRNTGAQTATNVVVDAGLPAGLVFTSASVSQGSYNLFFEEFRVGDLAPGEEATLRLTLFTLVDEAPITQFVEVKSAGTPDRDSDPGNDVGEVVDEDDEAAITINPGRGGGGFGDGTADLSLEIGTLGDGPYVIFQTVPYFAIITNDGPDTANNVVVDFGLPDGLVFNNAETEKGSYNLFFEEWTVGSLAPGESATLFLTGFTLIDDTDVRAFAQVLQVDEMDPDSDPANANGEEVSEDDEAAVTIRIDDRDVDDDGVLNEFDDDFMPDTMMLRRSFGDLDGAEAAVTPTLLQAGQSPTYALSLDADRVEVRVVSATGQIVNSQVVEPVGGTATGTVDMRSAGTGLYLVQFAVDGQPLSSQRVVVR